MTSSSTVLRHCHRDPDFISVILNLQHIHSSVVDSLIPRVLQHEANRILLQRMDMVSLHQKAKRRRRHISDKSQHGNIMLRNRYLVRSGQSLLSTYTHDGKHGQRTDHSGRGTTTRSWDQMKTQKMARPSRSRYLLRWESME